MKVVALLVLSCSGALAASRHGLSPSPSELPRSFSVHGTGVQLAAGELPQHFDWRNVNGRSFVVADVNQHIPQYCGACWIHGTVAQINDRIKVLRSGAWPDVMLARQTLLNCVPGFNNSAPPGCYGGDSFLIYHYMLQNKVPDETCNTWRAVNEECTAMNICSNCDVPAGYLEKTARGEDVSGMDYKAGCKPMRNFVGYGIREFGTVKGEEAMMREIHARGPISCTMDAHDPFMLGYSSVVETEGVFVSQGMNDTDHLIEVVGWGVTAKGIKYWVVRNSWGTYWGQMGWFKIERGVNMNNIELDCSWVVPEFDDLDKELLGVELGDYHLGVHKVNVPPPLTLAASLADRVWPWQLGLAWTLTIACTASLTARFARRGAVRVDAPLLA